MKESLNDRTSVFNSSLHFIYVPNEALKIEEWNIGNQVQI